jgi:hypothetical protein
MRYNLPNLGNWSSVIINRNFSYSDLRDAVSYLTDVIEGRWRPGREIFALGMSTDASLDELWAVKNNLQRIMSSKLSEKVKSCG